MHSTKKKTRTKIKIQKKISVQFFHWGMKRTKKKPGRTILGPRTLSRGTKKSEPLKGKTEKTLKIFQKNFIPTRCMSIRHPKLDDKVKFHKKLFRFVFCTAFTNKIRARSEQN